jgi:hypothetical protein
MESIGACSATITEDVSFMAKNSVLISLISSFKLKINKNRITMSILVTMLAE